MKDNDKIEKIFARATAPSVRAGIHRENLKAELMDRFDERDVQMKMDKPRKFKGLIRVAAMILAAVVLVSAGWAAEQAYRKIAWITWIDLKTTSHELTLPSGKKLELTTSITSGVTRSDQDVSIEQAKADQAVRREEMPQAIVDGKYTFRKEYNNPYGGPVAYIYSIDLPSGPLNWAFDVPLEKFESWEQFEDLEEEARRKYSQMCDEAIEAGRYRLVDVKAELSHICREVETGEEIFCQRLPGDSEPTAYIQPWPLKLNGRTKTIQTTWQDHLDAIADGSRELIEPFICSIYIYELTLSDGRVVHWSIAAGDKPPLE